MNKETRNDLGKPDRRKFFAFFPFIGLILVLFFFQIASGGRLFTARNLRTVLNEGFFIMIGSIGYGFVMTQGNLDFSIGPNIALSAATAVLLSGFNPVLGIAAGILVSTLVGLTNGLLHVYFRINAFVTTLAVQFILSGFLIFILGGGNIPAPLYMVSWNTISLKLIVLCVILTLGFIVFNFTPFGKQGQAVGANTQAAWLSGVNVWLVKTIPFVIMGFLCGILGFFSLIRTGTASNHTGGDMLMNVLNAVLLGGLPITGGASAKYRAVIIGSLTMSFLTNGMAMLGMDSFDRQLIKGFIFLITIALSFDRKNMAVIK
jgi:ribose transport system permease protein